MAAFVKLGEARTSSAISARCANLAYLGNSHTPVLCLHEQYMKMTFVEMSDMFHRFGL